MSEKEIKSYYDLGEEATTIQRFIKGIRMVFEGYNTTYGNPKPSCDLNYDELVVLKWVSCRLQ